MIAEKAKNVFTFAVTPKTKKALGFMTQWAAV